MNVFSMMSAVICVRTVSGFDARNGEERREGGLLTACGLRWARSIATAPPMDWP